MTEISNNGIITMTRGDSFKAPLLITRGPVWNSVKYFLSAFDTIYFSITEPHQDFNFGVIRKTYTSKDIDEEYNINIKLSPEDTENLLDGTYYYTIKLQDKRDNVFTLVDRKKFILL